ncbi:MAG: porin family protein [Cyclobacteriaceae bacterium]
MKIELSKSIVLLFVFVFVQEASSQRIGLNAGINFNNVSAEVSDDFPELSSDTELKIGYRIGLVIDIELSDSFGFQPGLIFSSKGFSNEKEGDDYDRSTLNYLEIPLNARLNISEKITFLLGPYVAVGVGGKNKFRSNGEVVETSFNFGPTERPVTAFQGNNVPLRTIDYGLNIGIGYSVGVTSINFGYGIGLSNMFPHFTDGFGNVVIDSDDIKFSSRVISLSISHFINE